MNNQRKYNCLAGDRRDFYRKLAILAEAISGKKVVVVDDKNGDRSHLTKNRK